MRRSKRLRLLAATAVLLVVAVPGQAQEDGPTFAAFLDGYSEVPTLSTVARGSFRATPDDDASELTYELGYSGFTQASVAHIHLGRPGTNGGVMLWLCGGGGRPSCPAQEGTVTDTVSASDVVGPAGQGLAPGDWDAALKAIGAGATYVNVHSAAFPGGEIRGQVVLAKRAQRVSPLPPLPLPRS